MKRREVTTTSVVYDGECPECGAVQTSSVPSNVDTECYACEHKRDIEELVGRNQELMDARIVELRGLESISGIVVKNDAGTSFEIVAGEVEFTVPDLEITEIKRDAKEPAR